MPDTRMTLYRLASLSSGGGKRLNEVPGSARATRGCLETANITPGPCLDFLRALVRQHVFAVGAPHTFGAVAQGQRIKVGEPMPPLQKYVAAERGGLRLRSNHLTPEIPAPA